MMEHTVDAYTRAFANEGFELEIEGGPSDGEHDYLATAIDRAFGVLGPSGGGPTEADAAADCWRRFDQNRAAYQRRD